MAWLNSSQNARSNWPGVRPRSWQISTMTAPMGWRRTSAAISASVGRWARNGGLGRGRCGRRPDYFTQRSPRPAEFAKWSEDVRPGRACDHGCHAEWGAKRINLVSAELCGSWRSLREITRPRTGSIAAGEFAMGAANLGPDRRWERVLLCCT